MLTRPQAPQANPAGAERAALKAATAKLHEEQARLTALELAATRVADERSPRRWPVKSPSRRAVCGACADLIFSHCPT